MARSDLEIETQLHKKLIKRDGGQEVFGALIGGAFMLVTAFSALQLSGILAIGLWTIFFFQLLGMAIKAAGWRSVTLTNDEQDWLKKNYNPGLTRPLY